jgi:two-component system, cell cycle response regulator DivK
MQADSWPYLGAERRRPSKRVLIVEDNPLDAALFEALLGSEGYDVLKAANAADGLELARQCHPDLIIMDVRLPDMSGFQATRSLKTDDETRNIPVLVTSAYGPYADKRELRDCGCDGYMPTPIESEAFIELMRSFLDPPKSSNTS